MKKLFFVLVLLAGATLLTAQALRKTEKIEADQVPVAIRGAFENDFGNIPEGGYWTATFTIERKSKRSTAKPLFYTFHKKNKSEKIEVRYTTEGKLDFVKGLEKPGNTNT